MKISASSDLPHVSDWLVRLFSAYNRYYLGKNFHSIRILQTGLPQLPENQAAVIYLNHSSWWDPLVCIYLNQIYGREKTSYGPMDRAALERYRFLSKIGMFGVEQNTTRGAKDFLRITEAILGNEQNILWLTPQGRFSDARERPVHFQAGLGALAKRSPAAVYLPLAIELTHWTERRPELLLSFGKPILPATATPHSSAEWTRIFVEQMISTQDQLATASLRRTASDWLVLSRGAASVNPFYDAWRRASAKFAGREFQPEHHVELTK